MAHVIRFLSFVGAFMFHPTVSTTVGELVQFFKIVDVLAPFVVTYIIAIWVLPEVGYALARMAMSN